MIWRKYSWKVQHQIILSSILNQDIGMNYPNLKKVEKLVLFSTSQTLRLSVVNQAETINTFFFFYLETISSVPSRAFKMKCLCPEYTVPHTDTGRFGHWIMPAGQVFRSLQGCLTSRTSSWITLLETYKWAFLIVSLNCIHIFLPNSLKFNVI